MKLEDKALTISRREFLQFYFKAKYMYWEHAISIHLIQTS